MEPASFRREVRDDLRASLRDPVARLGLATLGVLALAYTLPFVSAAARYELARYYQDVPLLLLGVYAASRRSRDVPHGVERRFWVLVSGALACWIAVRFSQALPLISDFRYVWWPFAQDVLFLCFYVCLALAIEDRPDRPEQGALAELLRAFHSSGAVVFAAGLLFYHVVLPGLLNPAVYGTRLPTRFLYLALDTYLLARLITLGLSARVTRWRLTYFWLGVAASLWLVSDAIEGLWLGDALNLPDYGTLWDALWNVPLVCVLIATHRRRRDDEPAHSAVRIERPAGLVWGGPLAAYVVALPAMHFLMAALGWLDEETRAARELLLLVLLGTLAAIMIVYQSLLARERARLSAEADERRRQAQRLEALGQLAAGVAHDFNNLLTIVVTYIGFVKRGLTAGQDELRRDIAEIEAAAQRGATMVRRLIGFAKRRQSATAPVDLYALVADATQLAGRVLPATIDVRLERRGPSPVVRAEPSAIEQILVNLLTNARDAMPAGGRIVVAVGTATLDAERSKGASGNYGYVVVTDNGVGMDSDTRARLFEPFFTTKGEGFGSGLGMPMVADLVRLQYGVVEVDSAPGRGTSVTVYLRQAPASESSGALVPPAAAVAPAALTGTETILLVEDEAAIRTSARRLLERQGYRVLEARDGADALATYRKHAGEIALVLSDVVMPRMTGPELHHAIGGGVKFLLMTGYTAGETWAGVKPDPMPSVLHKPWMSEELLTAVRATLDGAKG